MHTCDLFSSKQVPVVVRSSHSATTEAKGFTIPKPTWSISSLQLHESHTPASMDELQILAKRSVLDLHRFDDETRQQLCQDLGNMLHMMKQVQSYQSTMTSDHDQKYTNENDDDPIMLYDIPRGVTETPFRRDDNLTTMNTTTTTEDHNVQRISQSVRESYLEPKMKRVGGHQYYEIITSIQRKQQ
jgi:hypothetical protein